MTSTNDPGHRHVPSTFQSFVAAFPALAESHESIARTIQSSGPLDRKTCELIKIGISLGAGLETATRSHIRRAREHGASEAEVEQAVLLAYNSCGFPRAVMGWKWAREEFAHG